MLDAILASGRPVFEQQPWPRAVVEAAAWTRAAAAAGSGELVLLGLWGEPGAVHMALGSPSLAAVGVVSLACPERRFPSVGRHTPAAIRLERAVADLHGLVAEDAPDARPWLDHGRWGEDGSPAPYAFLPVEGDSLHRIPVGPVHAGIIEPGHFRFTASGETVVRLEARLGYVHKGVESLMAGAPVARAAQLAGRTSGDSTVAYAWAFSRAVEAASGTRLPARAHWLRALMAELERIANHLGDIGAICNDAAFSLMHAHCGILRERVLRAAHTCFGHRLMRDVVVPGGVAADLTAEGRGIVAGLLAEVRARFPELVDLYDSTASLQDRTVATGIVAPELVRRFGAGGYVGRAAGRAVDARRAPGYAPYDQIGVDVVTRGESDVNARVWVRIDEVTNSLALIERLLAGLPGGAVRTEIAPPTGAAREGIALVEAFRGDLLAWVRLAPDGRVARCHLRDASWFQWPLLEAAIEGNIVADFPLCNKSFNCSYSGHDL